MRDEVLYNLFKDFVFEIYPLINSTLEKRFIKPTYDKYPSLKYADNGFPTLNNYSFNSPTKISALFQGWGGKADITLVEFNSYNKLKEYLLNHEEYKKSVYPPHYESEEKATNFYNIVAATVIEDILERYYLLNILKTQDENLLKTIYQQFENYTYIENLTFDLAVPILFTGFTNAEFDLNENMQLRKISDEYQKARFDIRSTTSLISDTVISAATHELVFKNYFIKKDNKYFGSSLANESAFPVARFELFFNALKVVTNNNSGFAQILVYPHDWVDFFNIDLPPLKGISVKKYPNYFDSYPWNSFYPSLTEEELEKVSIVFNKLLRTENNKIQIANRRLRSSYLRDNEEDSILDIIIALETLLSDNEKGEITHKLALRTAKLLSVYNKQYDALEVFDAVKKIYDFRSALVHGSNKVDTKREIKLHPEAVPIKAIALANDFLREIVGILIENPTFLNPREIDKLLLK